MHMAKFCTAVCIINVVNHHTYVDMHALSTRIFIHNEKCYNKIKKLIPIIIMGTDKKMIEGTFSHLSIHVHVASVIVE